MKRLVLILMLLAPVVALAANELIKNRRGVRFAPAIVQPEDGWEKKIRMPAGFEITRFAADLGEPRMLAVGEDGTVYVTRREPGDVLALKDEDGDGRADSQRTVVQGLEGVHGIVLHDGAMYLATVNDVYKASLEHGAVGTPSKILEGLPPGGRHPNRTLGVGPDNRLYISVGSTCNVCVEEHEESAAIIRAGLDGGGRELFATGLRNTIGFGWHPSTGEMWGFDHGSDWLGNTVPPEELNLLEAKKHYGWPFVYDDNQLIELESYPPDFDRDAYLKKSTPMVMGYDAHAAPIQMAFYTGDRFPAEYRGDAFAAMHGSWNRKPPAGFEVVRVDFENGKPRSIESFASGFLSEDGASAFARPAGLAVAQDGALLVGDDANGIIYRVSFEGGPGSARR